MAEYLQLSCISHAATYEIDSRRHRVINSGHPDHDKCSISFRSDGIHTTPNEERLPLMPGSVPRMRRVLYVGDLGSGGTCQHRFDAIRRLGQLVQPFDIRPYEPKNRAASWLRFRYPFGPLITRVNRDLINAIETFRPDVVWFDKPLVFTPETVQAAKQAGARIVFYVQDSPFGPRDDGCWRQFLKIYHMADLHCLVREADIPRYSGWGLPWIKIMLCFDLQAHFPPPSGFGEADRNREVSYIGHPYEQRPKFLLNLARDHQLPIFVNGSRWSRALTSEQLQHFTIGNFLANEQYRSGIWKSKVNLSFVTEDNEEDIALKAIEIAGCAGFLLAVRTPGHQAIFEEDREAVFFSSVEECADKARFYLNRPDLREVIAARGRDRAVRSGYDNDTQLARVLNRLDGKA
jgi:spore maturation protein CgeB